MSRKTISSRLGINRTKGTRLEEDGDDEPPDYEAHGNLRGFQNDPFSAQGSAAGARRRSVPSNNRKQAPPNQPMPQSFEAFTVPVCGSNHTPVQMSSRPPHLASAMQQQSNAQRDGSDTQRQQQEEEEELQMALALSMSMAEEEQGRAAAVTEGPISTPEGNAEDEVRADPSIPLHALLPPNAAHRITVCHHTPSNRQPFCMLQSSMS